MEKKRCTAIVLAAGSGSRMKSDVAKQYMKLGGKPIVWYALQAVEQSQIIDDCVLVTGADDIEFVREDIVEKYGFTKVDIITAGGAERYHSVANALRAIADGGLRVPNEDGYVFIHDGARPFLNEKILNDTFEAVKEYHACVAAVRSKDTVKLADDAGFVVSTPNRKNVWNIQTPQVFDIDLITAAYEQLLQEIPKLKEKGIAVTDDAGVAELFTGTRVKLVEASYENIKITTPEDLPTAEVILSDRN